MTDPSSRGFDRPRDFSPAQLKLIRRSIARKCTDTEFDEFIAVCVQSGLDPLRRQIAPLVLNADDPEKRRLLPWATIDGLRVIAARQGDYRPMETAPIIERDQERCDADTNPLGIVRAEVRCWKRSHDAWHPVVGEAWWDEYAPLREAAGEPGVSGASGEARRLLEPSWLRMGRIMIAKCAESQALRRGWPDLLSGLYGEEELHRLRLVDQTASERLRMADEEAAKRKYAARTLWFIFEPGGAYEAVPIEAASVRIRDHYSSLESVEALSAFQDANRLALQILWEWTPHEALDLKLVYETRCAELAPATNSARATRRRTARRAKQKVSDQGAAQA